MIKLFKVFGVSLAVAVLLVPRSAAAQVEQVLTVQSAPDHIVRIVRSSDASLIAKVERPNQSAVEIELPTNEATFTDAFIFQQSRVILFAGYSTPSVFILDLTSATLADYFIAHRPSVSVDAKYIAFTRTIGRVERIDIGAVYLLYDLTKNPGANRMSNVPFPDPRTRVGIAVFPEWNRDAHSYSATVSEQGLPTLRKSPIVWVAPNAFVFLHQRGIESEPVLIDAETFAARIQPIASEPILGSTAVSESAAGGIVATAIIPLSYTPASCRVRLVFVRGLKMSSLEVEW